MVEKTVIQVGEYEFTVRLSGRKADDLIVLLHGFPETSVMWSKLMTKLSSLGFFCIAPNMRGYSPGACPKGVTNYLMQHLRNDIVGLADYFGKDRFHLIGHDWGAAIGWSIAFHHPDRIKSWTALSVPHNRAFGKALRLDKEQRKKSSYIRYFLLPWIPEMMLKRSNFRMLKKIWKRSSPKEVEDYLEVFSSKGAITAALNYYRANIGRKRSDRTGDINVPTLFIWGKKDVAVGEFAANENASYVSAKYSFLPVEGGHWLMQTNYTEVEEAIIDHLEKNKKEKT